jgi:uncharacterized LabA/DUF88 family protein
MSESSPRVAVFIDGANIFYTQRDKLHWWIDFKKLRSYFDELGSIVECIFYTGQGAPPEVTQEKFLDFLSHNGYSIETKTIKTIQDADGTTSQKANLDIELVLDMFNQIDNYDLAILVSGDGDFERPLKLLRARGKSFRVLSTQGAVAQEIRRFAGPNYIDLQTLRSLLERARDARN